MIKWEYKKVKIEGIPATEEMLNEYGKDGWELFHIEYNIYEDDGIVIKNWADLIFKKQVFVPYFQFGPSTALNLAV